MRFHTTVVPVLLLLQACGAETTESRVDVDVADTTDPDADTGECCEGDADDVALDVEPDGRLPDAEVDVPELDAPPDAIEASSLCAETGGTWLLEACGNTDCGRTNPCDQPAPGCDCGQMSNYRSGIGCVPDESCDTTRQDLCESTGGQWDATSCGDWRCGLAPACDAIIPGCNCGADSVFTVGEGCEVSPLCEPGSFERRLCEISGGTWTPESCGHTWCGLPGECAEINAGCDCGSVRNFDGRQGCVLADECAIDPRATLCESSGGSWNDSSCGDYFCGAPPTCEALIPGCDCGEFSNFVDDAGCQPDASCADISAEVQCVGSGGRWDANSCGDYRCGEPPGCLAVIPGCDCGLGSNFNSGFGCVEEAECLSDEPEFLCEYTGGTWDTLACGDYQCGVPNECAAIIPGCNCGIDANFVSGAGCSFDEACIPANPDAQLCRDTGGTWDEVGCGFECGEPSPILCLLPIADCDCPSGTDFEPGRGCALSSACGPVGPEFRCESTGGRWEPASCGDYVCGAAPLCEAVIPGCNCGTGRNFDDEAGCSPSDECRTCPDPLAPEVHYVGESNLDPSICTRILFECEMTQTPFSSECGCGCIDTTRIP